MAIANIKSDATKVSLDNLPGVTTKAVRIAAPNARIWIDGVLV